MSYSFCPHRNVARRPYGTRFLDLAPCLALAIGGWLGAHPAAAAIYTYSNVSGGTTQWSAGTDWNAVPVSAPTTSLLFTGTQAVSAATVSNNDISGNFELANATVSVTGTTGSTYAITGNTLAFSSTSGTSTFLINLPAGTKPTVQINNPLVVNTGMLLISNNNSNSTFYNVNGVVSGTGMLAIRSSGTGGYNSANAASGAGGLNSSNSFSGGFWFQQGTLYTGSSAISSVIGMTGQNSMMGSTGAVTLGATGTTATLRLNPTASGTTDRTFIVGGTGGATLIMAPVNAGTTTFGMGAITSGTGGDRRFTFTTSGNNTDVFSVRGLVSDNADGSRLAINMNGSGSGFVVLSNTANSFSGGVSIAGNTAGRTYDVSVPQIGNAGSSSPLGTSGTVNIGGSNGFAMLTWTGTTAETTNKVVNLTNTASGVAAIENNGIGRLTFTSDFTVSSPGAKQLSFFGTGTTEIASRIVDVSPGAATSVRKGSNGTLILSGSNTYTGNTDVNQGTLQFTAGALDSSAAIIFSNVGILQYATGNTQDVSGKIQFTTGSAAATINTNGNDVTFATAIAAGAAGSGTANTFYKSGLGTLTLAPGSGSNGWANGTVVQQGVLNFASVGALGGGTIRVSSGTLQYGTGVTDDISSRFTLTAGSYGTIDTNGSNVTFANPVVATGTGNGGLIKAGVGTLTLTASASYTLGTTVNGGTLALGSAASLASSSFVSVGTGATFDVQSVAGGFMVAPTQSVTGLGTVAGSMTVGGGATVAPGTAPGTSIGTLSVSQGVTWGLSGNYNWQMLSGTGAAGTGTSWDLLTVGGTLSIASTAADPFKINLWTLTSTSTAGDVSGTAANFNPTQNYTWKIASASGGVTGFATDKFAINTSATNGTGGFANGLAGGTFSIAQSGNAIDLVFTAAAPSAITINVGSGTTQTQTQAGHPTLSGSLPLVKTGGGTLVLTAANTLTGTTSVQQGTLQLANAAALASSKIVPVAGGTVSLTPYLQTAVGGLAPNAGGLVDLGNGLATAASGLTPTELVTAILAGRGDGSWTGTTGITSSVAASDVAVRIPRAVGWLDNGDGSVTAAFAAPGDTNLDWVVDVLDASNFLSFGKYDTGLPATWLEGDFNYDGVVDVLDAADFIGTGLYDTGNYNTPAGNAGAVAAVPEPSGLALLACVSGIALAATRRGRTS